MQADVPVPNLGTILAQRVNDDAVALIDVGTGTEYSCRQLERRVVGIAHWLRNELGLQSGARVAIFAANSASYLTAWLGIMRAGLICVPVNTRQTHSVLDFVCKDADVQLVLADDDNLDRVPQGRRVLPLAQVDNLDCDVEAPKVTTPRLAMIMYTSGSTGLPKGVMLSHASQYAMLQGITDLGGRKPFAGQRGVVAAPLFHMNATIFLSSLLMGGGSAVLLPRFDALAFIDAISRHRVHIVTGVPTMIGLMAREARAVSAADLSCVQLVYIGSAPLSESIVDLCRQMMPNAAITNGYGTTETGGGIFGSHPKGIPTPITSVGYPLPHVDVRLTGGNPSEGVLEVRTPTAMDGYLNRPDLTEKKVHEGWITTGDIFRIDEDGFYHFVGRSDDMFVCGGENIWPGEVEAVIDEHPDVVQSCVVPQQDTVRGQVPVAFVVSKASLSEDDIKRHVLSKAPPYMHPRRVIFLDQLPLSGTNKVDRAALMKRLAE